MLIKNVKIWSDGEVIEHGYIVTDGEKISKVGAGDAPAYDGEVIDGNGMTAYPGWIDAHTHIGLMGDALGFESMDINEAVDPVTPQLRGMDALNPRDRCFEDAWNAGVTTVVTGPGSANPIGGKFVATHTYGRRIDDMAIKKEVCMKFALGENPKRVYNGQKRSPMTRMATAATIREALTKAKDYAAKKDAAKNDATKSDPPLDFKMEALMPVVKRELVAHFHAHRADDVFTAIRIAKEFELDYTIVHCTEGWLVPEELADEHISVITGPSLHARSKPECANLGWEDPVTLNKYGLAPAICTDHNVIPEQYLPMCAGLACANGMPKDDALRAITINAAKCARIDDMVGAIKEGLYADVILYDCDPFELEAKPTTVIIAGKKVK